MRVAAVILAAGSSTRFGSPKQLALLGGRPVQEWAVAAARATGLDPVLVVTAHGVSAPPGTEAVTNPDPASGLSSSLRLGITSLPADVDGAVILLADQPTVSAGHIRALLDQSAGGRPVTATRAEGRLGPPILLHRVAFGLVDEAVGDSGLGPVLSRRPELVAALDVPRHGADVDTPEDLARLEGDRATDGG